MKLAIELENSDLPVMSLASHVTVNQPVTVSIGDLKFKDLILDSQSFHKDRAENKLSVTWIYKSQ